ncbi:Asp23/Gls24 family envelope stress response protein [Nocardiopsis sp. MG754419]|uniref:Asp23/Gls24 family envelope stress response protein n=1 Tax=Nocardiopsis sp. MG754419 TaxID=2259865 RepID=UPI001BA802D5|nr:Asp23/Gls24 family envelope stress response protein [Nocardiopsis sp. MG754419]MBR8742230.1 Asp23/Gls24 family envelope stress response protein [Nocardiopsis sp. MG754419]
MAAKNTESARTDLQEAGGATSSANAPVLRTDRNVAGTEGRTEIADHVVAKIAGMAAREVGGVHRMGGGAGRAFDAVRERIPGSTSTSTAARGVAVEVGQTQTAVDIHLIVDYGISIPDLAAVVRRNVTAAVERMTGLEVTEVNITIDDIHLPDEEGQESSAEPRVR